MAFSPKKVVLGIIIISIILVLFFLLFTQIESKEYHFSSSFLEGTFVKDLLKSKSPPLNILFLGIVGEGSRGSLLTDTVFVIHLNPEAKKIAMVSIPRDLWVKVPNTEQEIKINNLYELENRGKVFPNTTASNLISQKIEDITGLKIDHTIILELEGFGKLIDTIGGIDIWLEQDIFDPQLINPHNPSEIFYLASGWRHLDGDTAIKFVRTRYAPEGDFYRIQHQQQIIAALKNKLSQLADIWNLMTWLKMWQSLNNHFIVDLDFNALWQIFNLVKDISADQIEYIKITNRPPDQLLLTTTFSDDSLEKNIYILIPRKGFEEYEEIQDYIKEKISF